MLSEISENILQSEIYGCTCTVFIETDEKTTNWDREKETAGLSIVHTILLTAHNYNMDILHIQLTKNMVTVHNIHVYFSNIRIIIIIILYYYV